MSVRTEDPLNVFVVQLNEKSLLSSFELLFEFVDRKFICITNIFQNNGNLGYLLTFSTFENPSWHLTVHLFGYHLLNALM